MTAQNPRAFTLIELLIVVAIIAILAAVAVPNFLEAQTRSKVTRVIADMRATVTAIEMYRMDNANYPGDSYDWTRWGAGANDPKTRWPWVLVALTTPVAYMSGIPIDPFVEKTYPGCYMSWYVSKTGYFVNRHDRNDPMSFFAPPRDAYKWAIISPGPDLFWEFDRNEGDVPYTNIGKLWPSGQGDVIYYDATNGTVSMGDIFYYGPGGGFNPEPHPSR